MGNKIQSNKQNKNVLGFHLFKLEFHLWKVKTQIYDPINQIKPINIRAINYNGLRAFDNNPIFFFFFFLIVHSLQ